MKVYRNGELVQTISESSQNKAVTWTDTPSADGYYIYKVVPYNASGDGVYKEYAAFVGEDLPGEPQNVTVLQSAPTPQSLGRLRQQDSRADISTRRL